jgi:hypothetical protein
MNLTGCFLQRSTRQCTSQLCQVDNLLTSLYASSAVYMDVEPPDHSYVKERMEDIVRAKQKCVRLHLPYSIPRTQTICLISKMVNVQSATPSYLNDSGLPTSRSNGSISRTRERPIRTSSRSPPPPSTRSDSSTSLIRNTSNLKVPNNVNNTMNHHRGNIRVIKGGLSRLERGRSQTLKRRTIEPDGTAESPEQAVTEIEPVANDDAGEASSAGTTLPTGSQESIAFAVSKISWRTFCALTIATASTSTSRRDPERVYFRGRLGTNKRLG